MFDEFVSGNHLLELFLRDEVEVLLGLLKAFTSLRSGGVRFLSLEEIAILGEDIVDEGLLSNTRWPDENEWLLLERRSVEWVEVFLGVDEDVVLNSG